MCNEKKAYILLFEVLIIITCNYDLSTVNPYSDYLLSSSIENVRFVTRIVINKINE